MLGRMVAKFFQAYDHVYRHTSAYLHYWLDILHILNPLLAEVSLASYPYAPDTLLQVCSDGMLNTRLEVLIITGGLQVMVSNLDAPHISYTLDVEVVVCLVCHVMWRLREFVPCIISLLDHVPHGTGAIV